MKINELVKNDRVILNYGSQNGDMATCGSFDRWQALQANGASFKAWEADVVAKPRGKQPTVVFLKVYGFGTDMGDTYAHNIMAVKRDGAWVPITLEPKQLEMKAMVEAMGM